MRESDLRGDNRRVSRPVRLGLTAICAAAGLLAAACQGAATGAQGSHGAKPAGPAAAQISITPANGSRNVRPSVGVVVTSTGKITNVTVLAGHAQTPVPGTLATGATSWRTLWPLHTSTHYTVTVTAVNTAGHTVTAASSFRTLTPAATLNASTLEGLHQTYGVGMPIVINFSSPVTRKAAVEKAIDIRTSVPVVGSWAWDGDQLLFFRPQGYWPQYTKVAFHGHFDGVEFAPGVWGTADLSQSFQIGYSLIGVTNTATHLTKIYYKGKYYQTWSDSSGAPGRDTANGTYLTIEKANPTLMSGPGYHNLPVFWSVRFTWSGNYYHSAPWSLGVQGFANVSHGCVNLSPEHAQWYYEHEVPGDPITITHSPVAGTWDDGYTEWFWTWDEMLAHSATHMAVQAGPTGSSFIDPSTVTPVGSFWTIGAKTNNWHAG